MRRGPSWGKKDKRCDPADPDDATQGSNWDHVIIDPETKLIISLVVGRRHADTVVQVFTDFYDRTDGALPELITTDGYAVYEAVVLDTYGVWREELGLTPKEEAGFERTGMPAFYFPVEITYATVHKEREGGRVVEVTSQVVLGSEGQAEKTLQESERSRARFAPGIEEVIVRCFTVEAPADWEPTLNEEHDDYCWCSAPEAAELLYWPEPGELVLELHS